jgi:hypothetical protein
MSHKLIRPISHKNQTIDELSAVDAAEKRRIKRIRGSVCLNAATEGSGVS